MVLVLDFFGFFFYVIFLFRGGYKRCSHIKKPTMVFRLSDIFSIPSDHRPCPCRILITLSSSIATLIVTSLKEGNLCMFSLKRSLYSTCFTIMMISVRSLASSWFRECGNCWKMILSTLWGMGKGAWFSKSWGMISLVHSKIPSHMLEARLHL